MRKFREVLHFAGQFLYGTPPYYVVASKLWDMVRGTHANDIVFTRALCVDKPSNSKVHFFFLPIVSDNTTPWHQVSHLQVIRYQTSCSKVAADHLHDSIDRLLPVEENGFIRRMSLNALSFAFERIQTQKGLVPKKPFRHFQAKVKVLTNGKLCLPEEVFVRNFVDHERACTPWDLMEFQGLELAENMEKTSFRSAIKPNQYPEKLRTVLGALANDAIRELPVKGIPGTPPWDEMQTIASLNKVLELVKTG